MRQLAQTTGAILATSAPANGLFAGLPYALGISGGFASPFAAELLPQADVVLVFGASVNHWTTKHGALINPNATVIQTDVEAKAIGRNRPANIAIIGDAKATASALTEALTEQGHSNVGFRTPELADQIANRRWRHEPYQDASTDEWIDPRTLSIKLNEALPTERSDRRRLRPLPRLPVDVPRRPGRQRAGSSRTAFRPSGSASATRSARRSRGPTVPRSPRSATAARSWRSRRSRPRPACTSATCSS